MPNMVSLRKFRLSTTTGHVVNFMPNVPHYVPPEAVSAAMAAGCVPAEGADPALFDDASRGNAEFVGTLRDSLMHLVFARLVKENQAKNFDSGGVPKTEVLSKMLGFEVSPRERKRMFEQFCSLKSSGEQVTLHPKAQLAMDVLDADNKAELLLVANSMNVPSEDVHGLSSRDLRDFLIRTLSGAASVAA